MSQTLSLSQNRAPPPTSSPTFRSGAVARMAGMPVATLRVWEQRYQAVRPTTAPSGHRLYSQSDVERVTFLRRLSQRGYAIALLASLDNAQLRQLIQAPVTGAALPATPSAPPREPMRIVVVGRAIEQRLKRLAAAEPQARVFQVGACFDSLFQASDAARGGSRPRMDLLRLSCARRNRPGTLERRPWSTATPMPLRVMSWSTQGWCWPLSR